jgi:regulator of protease activity HflC (stomatin/prohibitin superfamily)
MTWFKGSVIVVVLLLCAAIGYSSCSLIEPGNVGIQVQRAGANRGVQDLPTVSGWAAFNPLTETVIEFPTTVQTAVWTAAISEGHTTDESITFSSREGVTVSSDVALSYHVDAAHAGRMYTRFRQVDLNVLTHGYVRNLVRDVLNEVASQMTITDIYGQGKTRLLNDVLSQVRQRMVAGDGFVIDQLSFQGALRLPQNVVDAINRSIQATQDAASASNRVAQIEAEARQVVARATGAADAARAEAHGAADSLLIRAAADAQHRTMMAAAEATANERIAASLTPAVVEYRRLERWNGVLPQVQGGGTPLISMSAR